MGDAPARVQLPLWKRVLFVVTLVAIPLLGIEFLLYKLDFTYQPRQRRMQFAFPDEKSLHDIYQPSEATLWELRPGFNFPDSAIEGVNALGMRGPEPDPAACRTVLMLGDSVVFGGATSISHELEAIWRSQPPGGLDCPVQVLNAGVPGFTSWQGLRWLEAHGAGLKPDLVIALFGWNDHWLAQGYPDKEQRTRSAGAIRAEKQLLKLKLYQALAWIIESASTRGNGQAGAGQKRVSVEDYAVNLKGFVEWCHRHSCRTVLLVPPMAETGATPPYIYNGGFLAAGEDLHAIHEQYNGVIRSLSAVVPVIELAPALSGHPVDEVFNAPDKDIIHPNEKGYQLLARWLSDRLSPMLADGAERPGP